MRFLSALCEGRRTRSSMRVCGRVGFLLGVIVLAGCGCVALAQLPVTHDPAQYGPYNGSFLADGLGLKKPLMGAALTGQGRASANVEDSVLRADSPWTMFCWLRTVEPVTGRELVAGLGNVTAEYPRYLALDAGKVVLWMGEGNELSAPALLKTGEWHLLAATFDGSRFHLYSDGRAVAEGTLTLGSAGPVLQMAPPPLTSAMASHFGGQIASFTLLREALAAGEVRRLFETPPAFSLMAFEEGSKPWPFQTRNQAGYRAPQDPATLPRSRAPFSAPVAIKRLPVGPSLLETGPGEWTFADGWTLREAPNVEADGARLSTPEGGSAGWMRATVPGTVLTTMVDDGIYPDPDFGLNNMAIPESLNKQDYWYRNEFMVPAGVAGGDHVELTFQGINYSAAVWLNGKPLGTVKGAFQRGVFDVSALLRRGEKNVLAVRISPPPHPGIPQEQSVLGGPGENGGAMVLDGPTFVATEGWDWIPAIRDRDSGIWQPVTLTVTRSLKIGDAQVITSLPAHDASLASLEIDVPVTNFSAQTVQATVNALFEDVAVTKTLALPPGETVVKLQPAEFPQLRVAHPRLWWPNGYGSPELYQMKLAVQETAAKSSSDARELRFGIREISYELSLLDHGGHLRRVEFSPTEGRGSAGRVVDVHHEGMRQIPSADATALNLPEERREASQYATNVASLMPGAEASPAIHALTDLGPAPYLVLKVNGVRIAARGGNWGMDDARKRVSRAHLEPFFRLNRDANLNIIRNWVGQSTEETFYELADEYGMLVWNDFWESTQNYNTEAEDPALFLANARDTILHFRNHPSIVLWCGRNEGVPQPIINTGLDELVRTLDGTRFYSPSSNEVNLQHSGPYSYQDPALYYTALNRGFSVETGTPSMSTLESFESTIAKEDQWPIGDAWAYHDWHQSGNGDVGTFMAEIEAELGAPTSLEDFERKAQMLNYVDHRAIFEGMNANLWTPNSGRMLWMTQPAWPSTMWQILSADYDTQASFYGTKKACEPVHVQLNLATYQVDIVNTTPVARPGLAVVARVYSLSNALLAEMKDRKDLAANASSASVHLNLAPYLAKGMVIVALSLEDASGAVVSSNLYWLGAGPASYRELNHLVPTRVTASATASRSGAMVKLTVELKNSGTVVSLANKLTLLAAKDKQRILPAYFSDNYISLLPGEIQTVEIEYPVGTVRGAAEIALRGWNTVAQAIPVVAAAVR